MLHIFVQNLYACGLFFGEAKNRSVVFIEVFCFQSTSPGGRDLLLIRVLKIVNINLSQLFLVFSEILCLVLELYMGTVSGLTMKGKS